MKKITKTNFCFFITFLSLIFFESVLRAFTFGKEPAVFFTKGLFIAYIMAAFFAAVTTLISVFIFKRFYRAYITTALIVNCIICCSQIVYYHIFSTFYTIYSMLNGSQVTEFQGIILDTILDEILPLSLCFLLTIILIVLIRKVKTSDRVAGKKEAVALFLVVVLALGSSSIVVNTADKKDGSPYDYLTRTNEIKGLIRSFGLYSSGWLDGGRLVLGFTPAVGDADAALSEYFSQREETGPNEKTGIYQGKNLIFITAESFTDFAVDSKYTPTLYKLANEGYTFTNYYNPIWGVSTLDGEYVNLVGLIPEAGVWSMTESADNYLPYTLGNQFTKLGYVTKAYHNHDINFYHRNRSHPNLGYDFDGQGGGFNFEKTWPESDLEMIDKTTEDFLTPGENGEVAPFHVYYLTVSGHLEYTFNGQAMSEKNRALVEDMEVSDTCKAYMAANIELDRAMELLLERLGEAGVLNDTVIAIAGDHYPYGLTADEISQLKGHKVEETYELYQSAFILWTPEMEPETVTKVGSNLDILPTLSNLFGLKYDSRLLMGTDLFSDKEGIVVFEDKNWITQRGKRDEIKDAEYVEKISKEVSDMFVYSALVLNRDYYRNM